MSNATSAEGDGQSEDSRASSPRPESPRQALLGAVPPIAEGEPLTTDIAGNWSIPLPWFMIFECVAWFMGYCCFHGFVVRTLMRELPICCCFPSHVKFLEGGGGGPTLAVQFAHSLEFLLEFHSGAFPTEEKAAHILLFHFPSHVNCLLGGEGFHSLLRHACCHSLLIVL